MSQEPIQIIPAALDDPEHGEHILLLLNDYASHPMGEGEALPGDVAGRLLSDLRKIPTARVLLAYADKKPVGLAMCFLGYSTFKGQPLINIHDLAVRSGHRGMGIGGRLLDEVEKLARRLGCCRVTLEVRDDNESAKGLYTKKGYGNGGGPPMLFWDKPLGD